MHRTPMRLALALLAAFVAGCAMEDETVVVYSAKPAQAPPLRYCCDAVGHRPGAKPFFMGGTCCCTPTQKLLEQYQRDGFLKGYTLSQLESEYESRGIQTDLNHRGCNNACRYGPHVVKGGKCMATPTPGTLNYDEVISGKFEPVNQAKENPNAK